MTTRSTHMRRKHPTPRALIALLIALTLPGAAHALFGGFSGVVFDPANFAENLRQAAALFTQIRRAATQMELQRQMLSDLPDSIVSDLRVASSAFAGSSAPVPIEIDSAYPIDSSGEVAGWLDEQRSGWNAEARSLVKQNVATATATAADHAPSRDRLMRVVLASNGIGADEPPGQVAALQAQTQLLALASLEIDKLIALRAARAHSRTALQAQRQSMSAYRAARCERLMRDWQTRPAATKPKPVSFVASR